MTIKKCTQYPTYNIYTTNISYDYDIDKIIAYGLTDSQSMIDAIVKEYLPGISLNFQAPNFGCSAFSISDENAHILMGRNYDFKNDSSALLLTCQPKHGYRSVATAALDNIQMNQPEKSEKGAALAEIAAPFICLDGCNEKGVSIAVLTLDSEPTYQHTGKPIIPTTLAIRLVLDRASSTKGAIALLKQYDMMATSGRDYHFYITDASGDGRVVEYDCCDASRPLVATPLRSITNFYGMYKEIVKPYQTNGIYGHGKERYDAMEKIFASQTNFTKDTAWQALQVASQAPNSEDITSNTQWSIVYDNTDLTAAIVLRRDWQQKIAYHL